MDQTYEPLCIADVLALNTLLTAAQRTAHVRWQTPNGDLTDGVARAISHDGGGFLRSGEDVRDGFLHVSGMFERWVPVRYLMTLVPDGLFAVDDETTETDRSIANATAMPGEPDDVDVSDWTNAQIAAAISAHEVEHGALYPALVVEAKRRHDAGTYH